MNSVFKENNSRTRRAFFSDPLIKYLWAQIFIKEAPETCLTYLRRLKSDPMYGTTRLNKFLQDIEETEANCNFKMLPDIARNRENITVFSQQEEYKDLLENGKYNKLQTD